jgi:hypothetical protein
MRVKLYKGATASPVELANLERRLGRLLPESYRKFATGFDGAKPDTNIFPIGNGNESGVNGFIKVSDIEQEPRHIENLGAAAFPVAWAEGGNYVVVDLAKEGRVFFWDHETAGLPQLSSDFDSFLSLLEPFNIDDIKLKPGQLKSAWIDPDFLKSLNGD